MARTAFPVETSLGTVFGLDPRVARERLLTLWSDIRGTSTLRNFVYSGMTLTAGGGLSVNVATGNAVVEGYLLEINTAAENKSGLTDGATNYIWAQITRDGNNVLTGWALVANTGTPVAGAVLLGVAVTAGGVVTSTINSPQSPVSPVFGSYVGSGAGTDRFIFVGVTPRYMMIDAGANIFQFGPISGGIATHITGPTITRTNGVSKETTPLLGNFGFTVKHTGTPTDPPGYALDTSGVTYRYAIWF